MSARRIVRQTTEHVHCYDAVCWIGRFEPPAWPARSPDLTPLDCFLCWLHVIDMGCRQNSQTTEEPRSLLTAQTEMTQMSIRQQIFVNNQLDAQFFFIYVYFYSLHVSVSHVPIIRRINSINTTSGVCHSV